MTQKEAVIARKEKDDPVLKDLALELMQAETPQQKAEVERKMEARRQVIRSDVYKTTSTGSFTLGNSGSLFVDKDFDEASHSNTSHSN